MGPCRVPPTAFDGLANRRFRAVLSKLVLGPPAARTPPLLPGPGVVQGWMALCQGLREGALSAWVPKLVQLPSQWLHMNGSTRARLKFAARQGAPLPKHVPPHLPSAVASLPLGLHAIKQQRPDVHACT